MDAKEAITTLVPVLPQIDVLLTQQEAEEFLRLARIEVQNVPSYVGRIQARPKLFDTEQD